MPIQEREGYDKTKFHGNLPIEPKCRNFWSVGLCSHQALEFLQDAITADELIQRDFPELAEAIKKIQAKH